MQSQLQLNKRNQAGYTLMEVALAIGLVAFGLVAVLGVLPAGLNVQKDNREETIIKLDAEYWMSALRGSIPGSPLPLDAFNQIEWIEVDAGPKGVFRAEYVKLAKDPWLPHPPTAKIEHDDFYGALKQSAWRESVTQWMLNPNVTTTLKVTPLNGPLFDRIYGRTVLVADGKSEPILPGGDFAFKYLLESRVTIITGTDLAKVTLTFRWPVLEDQTLFDSTKTAADVKTASTSSKTYTITVPLAPVQWSPAQPDRVVGNFILRSPRDYIPEFDAMGNLLRFNLPTIANPADLPFWNELFGFEPSTE